MLSNHKSNRSSEGRSVENAQPDGTPTLSARKFASLNRGDPYRSYANLWAMDSH